MDDMTLKNESEKAFLRRIGVGEVRDKIELVNRDQLMIPRINQLRGLMSKSEELAKIQDFIDADKEGEGLLVLNSYIEANENDRVKIVYTLFPKILRDLRKYSIERWPSEYEEAPRDIFYGRNQLVVAAKYGNFEIVKFLVENGVNSEYAIDYALEHYVVNYDPDHMRMDALDDPNDDVMREKYKNVVLYLAELEGKDIEYDEERQAFTQSGRFI